MDPKSPQELPDRCDVVIIGAGIGGLTAGAILSQAGLKTVVLEAETQPGGCLAGFRRDDYKFETAIHWLSQFGPGAFARNIFEFIGDDMPKCNQMQNIHRFVGDNYNYLLTANPLELRDEWLQQFPEDKEGIYRFFDDAARLGKHLEVLNHRVRTPESMSPLGRMAHGLKMLIWVLPILKYLRASAEEGLDRYFKSKELREVFSSQERFMSIIVPFAWASIGNFQTPPKGGGASLVHWLCRKLYQAGTTVYLDCPVGEVTLNGQGTVSGVITADGKTIRSDYVIAACDLYSLYSKMLPSGAVPEKLLNAVGSAELHESAFVIYIGLDCPPKALGLGEEIVNIASGKVSREDHMCGEPDKSIIMIVASSARDSSMAPEGKGSIMILTPAFMSYKNDWGTGPGRERGDVYRAIKKEYAEIVMARVAEKFPDLNDHITFMETSSPVTFWRYTNNKEGTMMGTKPVAANIRSKASHYRTPVKNLYVGGHCAEYGGGVPMAVRAGANSSLLVLKSMKHPTFHELKEVMS